MSDLEDTGKYRIENNAPVQWQIIGDNNIITASTDHYGRSLDDYLRALQCYSTKKPYTSLANILHLKHDETKYIYLHPYVNRLNKQVTEIHTPQEGERLSVTDMLNCITSGLFKPHALILGEPGMGKSMLLRFIAKYANAEPSTTGLSHSYLVFPIRCQSLALVDGDSIETRISRALLQDSEILLQEDPQSGFLFEWTQRMRQHVFFLLDGLDEVPRAKQEELWKWLRNLLTYVKKHHGANTHLVLTSRPIPELIEESRSIFTSSDDPLQTVLDIYQLQPFDTLQQQGFVEYWLNRRAQAFLQEIQSSHIQSLMRIPLLLIIAIAIYDKKGYLIKQRLALYDQFIEVCLNEADRNLLRRDLEPERTDDDRPIFESERRVLDIMASSYRPILEYLALSTIQSGKTSIEYLSNEVCSYLQKVHKLPKPYAEKWTPRFLEIISRRSGLLMRLQYTYIWLHPTICEYLASCALRSTYKKRWKRFVNGHWTSTQWQEVTLFLLAMLDRDNIDTMNFTSFLIRKMHNRGSPSCLIIFILFITTFLTPIFVPMFVPMLVLNYIKNVFISVTSYSPVKDIITCVAVILVFSYNAWMYRLINPDFDKNKDELLFLLRWLKFQSLPDDKVYDILKSLLSSIQASKSRQWTKFPTWSAKTEKSWVDKSKQIWAEEQRATLALELLKELDIEMIKRILDTIQHQESEYIQEAKRLQDMISPGRS